MATLQQQARALGDPTRFDVFRYIADAEAPVDVSDMTEHFGLNHNAIRQHLAKLEDAGLVAKEKAPSAGRGRPRHLYHVDPSAESRWGVAGPYGRLSVWLAEVVRTGESPVEVGRRAGRSERNGTNTEDPVAELVEQMARQGFEPSVTREGSIVDVTLTVCPFETAAIASPETICGLHLGLAYGIAEGIEGLEVEELVSKDPRHAHCRLRCHLAETG